MGAEANHHLMENFLPAHSMVLKAATECIASSRSISDCLGSEFKLAFVTDVPALWSSYTTLLRFIPIELFRSSKSFDLDVRHIVIGHLHDTGNRQLLSSSSFSAC